MKISPVNSLNIVSVQRSKKQFAKVSSNPNQSNVFIYKPQNIKAIYCPNFGKEKKIKETDLIDQKTGKMVKAKVYRDTSSITEHYYIRKNGEELGYMNLYCPKRNNDKDYEYTYPDYLPEVKSIRSLKGDEYEGIGTQLIKCAIERSEERGYGGELVLSAEQGYAINLSPYRSDENPIPFYYKLGFQAVEEDEDAMCRALLAREDYNSLPLFEDMILTSEGIPAFEEYYNNKFSR